ncbi:hypothetical protein A0H81_12866 [Grifola frondosa]|uniref:Uncharacterized protein n=1 Tax=Grifola frondosa TaxID=5627 RepID=A0A1C7LR24_GRIFR|nr:hypothetical protein A0H81_12866 [Grifola frondosa]
MAHGPGDASILSAAELGARIPMRLDCRKRLESRPVVGTQRVPILGSDLATFPYICGKTKSCQHLVFMFNAPKANHLSFPHAVKFQQFVSSAVHGQHSENEGGASYSRPHSPSISNLRLSLSTYYPDSLPLSRILGIIGLVLALIERHLPSTKVEVLEKAMGQIHTLLHATVEEGTLDKDFVDLISLRLSRLTSRTDTLSVRAHAAITIWRQCLEMCRGFPADSLLFILKRKLSEPQSFFRKQKRGAGQTWDRAPYLVYQGLHMVHAKFAWKHHQSRLGLYRLSTKLRKQTISIRNIILFQVSVVYRLNQSHVRSHRPESPHYYCGIPQILTYLLDTKVVDGAPPGLFVFSLRDGRLPLV